MKSHITVPVKEPEIPQVVFPVLLMTKDQQVVVLATGWDLKKTDYYTGFVVWSQREIDEIGEMSLKTWHSSYLFKFSGQVTLENE